MPRILFVRDFKPTKDGRIRTSGGHIKVRDYFMHCLQHPELEPYLYFTPRSLGDAASRAGLSLVHLERESTDLRRLTLSAPMRLLLRALLAVGRMTRLENRIFAIARADARPVAQASREPF